MVFSLLPAGAAVAVPDLCDGAPDAGFTDVTAGNTFRDDINCLAAYGITTGITATTYGPAQNVNRQQMAAFVLRYWEAATGDTLPVPATNQFSDIANVSPASTRNAINALANAGVISGFPDGTYRPGGDVRRDQMATFIANATEAAGLVLPDDAADDRFPDVRATATHSDNINILAELGIVGGFNDGTYRPGNDVSRQQMARFIINGAGALDADGKWDAELEVPTESNQTFTVTPQSELTVTDGTNDSRQYTVTNPVAGAEHRVQLINADNVDVDADGVVTFEARDTTRFADAGNVASRITVVNGTATSGTVTFVKVQPVGGQITFTVAGNGFESVVPLVFFDANKNDEFDLNADGTPVDAEPFGIGGQLNVLPPEAVTGDIALRTVQSVDKDANRIVAGGVSYFYGSLDTYQIATGGGSAGCVNTTAANFEAQLSVGDQISGTYQRGDTLAGTFCLDNRAPSAPVDVTAVSAGATSVKVDWKPSVHGDIDSYKIFRAAGTTVGTTTTCPDVTAASFSQVGTVAGNVLTFTNTGLTTGTSYCYAVSAVDDNVETARTAAAAPATPTADTTAPQATATTKITDAGFAGVMDAGDVFTVRFNEAMAAPAAGSTLRVKDVDGTVADVICGTNATCSLNASAIPATPAGPNAGAAANTVLTVTLTGAPTTVTAGTVAGVQYPATINNTTGIMDVSGNRLNLAAGDLTIGDAPA